MNRDEEVMRRVYWKIMSVFLTFAASRIIIVIFVAFLALIVVVVKHGDCEERNLQERNFL